MLQLKNHTRFACGMSVFANERGVECVYLAVKGTWHMTPEGLELAAEQPPLVPVDQPRGAPELSSLAHAGEMTLTKPGTDVLLIGQAYAPGGSAKVMDVRLSVGAMSKTVRVFGKRSWKSGLFGYKISDPEPFETMPLVYELAFGGTDAQPRNPDKVDFEPHNPIGMGLVPTNSNVQPEAVPLPHLEDPEQLIKGPKDRPAPAGFGPVCPHWMPRKQYAGTYDDAWVRKRAPYLPLDFDPRFLQVAPPGLVAEAYLQGGEPVEIVGASAAGTLAFELPACTLGATFHFDGRMLNPPLNLDTVVFDPDQERLSLVWRACLPVDKKLLRLAAVDVTCAEHALAKAA